MRPIGGPDGARRTVSAAAAAAADNSRPFAVAADGDDDVVVAAIAHYLFRLAATVEAEKWALAGRRRPHQHWARLVLRQCRSLCLNWNSSIALASEQSFAFRSVS